MHVTKSLRTVRPIICPVDTSSWSQSLCSSLGHRNLGQFLYKTNNANNTLRFNPRNRILLNVKLKELRTNLNIASMRCCGICGISLFKTLLRSSFVMKPLPTTSPKLTTDSDSFRLDYTVKTSCLSYSLHEQSKLRNACRISSSSSRTLIFDSIIRIKVSKSIPVSTVNRLTFTNNNSICLFRTR